jgi:FlaA1/EpsC-like NDP-sugar epimerase
MGAKKYFCVSTDKAANPVNMMGASKQIMEMFLMRESLTQKNFNGAFCQCGVF